MRRLSKGGSVGLTSMLLGLLAFGCGSHSLAAPVGYDYDVDAPEPSPPRRRSKPVPEDVVARAAAPLRALRVRDGVELRPAQLARELLRADAICFGEEHASASDHYAELWLLDHLIAFASGAGLELGLGLEMFQRPFQAELTSYQQGRSDEQELLRATDYGTRWGYAFAYYRPLLERARERLIPLVALNARRELTQEIARAGLDGLSDRWARELPTLDLNQAEHRAKFEQHMRGHPGMSGERLRDYYAAQVVWDETMAETGARWLASHAPVRRLLIIAGAAHCEQFAIPQRLSRRGPFRVVTVTATAEAPAAAPDASDAYALVAGAP